MSPIRLRAQVRGRARLVTLAASVALLLSMLPTGVNAVRVVHMVQLDTGTCGQNLQIGSDKTSSHTATPTFLIYGDGASTVYDVFVDGVLIGTYTANVYGDVCALVTTPLSNGGHV